ncbi:MAG: type II toxin-antitoxin system VapC family toxin, partial [Chloroflexi bacterium]|nr:type II toxin-antitoxin system VapC family toxin [Chloroflexota bacterium]
MSVTIDASILVYASNSADPAHGPAGALIQRLAAGPELVYLFWPTVMGYLRIVTHPAILPRPLAPLEAATNVANFLARAHVRS